MIDIKVVIANNYGNKILLFGSDDNEEILTLNIISN